jgi:hypothetical protein
MPIAMLILNVVLIVLVLAVLVGAHLYAVATQHRDHGAVHTGPVFRRRVFSERRRRSRPVTVERRTKVARGGQPWPAA